MHLSRFIFGIVVITFSVGGWAKTTSGKRGDVLSFAVGGGPTTMTFPAEQMDSNGTLFAEAGGEFKLLGPFFVTAALSGSISSGTMNYDFTDENDTRYTDPEMGYSWDSSEGRVGLKIRLINTSILRLYGEGGGYLGTVKLNYNTEESDVDGTGSTFEKSQKDITNVGYYTDAGIDIMVMKFGLRIGARYLVGTMGPINAVAKRDLRYETTYGYAALLKEL